MMLHLSSAPLSYCSEEGIWTIAAIAYVAISKRPLLFTVWTQLRLRSHQNFYEIFTRQTIFANICG